MRNSAIGCEVREGAQLVFDEELLEASDSFGGGEALLDLTIVFGEELGEARVLTPIRELTEVSENFRLRREDSRLARIGVKNVPLIRVIHVERFGALGNDLATVFGDGEDLEWKVLSTDLATRIARFG